MSKILLKRYETATPKESWDSSWQEVHEISEYYYNTKSKEITFETYEEYSNLRRPENNEKTLVDSIVIAESQLPLPVKEELRKIRKT